MPVITPSFSDTGWLLLQESFTQTEWRTNWRDHITSTLAEVIMPWCGELQGASSDWWNFRHLNHHSKPNILTKDPDVTFDPLLLVGRSLAIEVRCFLFIMQPSPRMLHYALHLARARCCVLPLLTKHSTAPLCKHTIRICRGQSTNKRNPQIYQKAFYKTLSGSMNAQVS